MKARNISGFNILDLLIPPRIAQEGRGLLRDYVVEKGAFLVLGVVCDVGSIFG